MDYEEYLQRTREGYKKEDVAEKYKKAYSRRISLRNFRSKIVGTRERQIVRSLLSFLKRKGKSLENVLDVPVGTGKMTDILLEYGLKITSGDISREMMRFIDSDLRNHPHYIEEQVVDAANLPFEDESFDLLVNIRLMHRVDSSTRSKILKEAFRVTRKYYIASFGLDNRWHSLRLRIKRRNSSPGRVPIKKIRKELQEKGFEILKEKQIFPAVSNEIILLLEKN